LRKAIASVKFANIEYSADQAASFIVANNQSISKNATTAKIGINLYNNNYPSTTDPITAANDAVGANVNAVIEGNAVAALYPKIESIFKAACIPLLPMYLTLKGYPTFGTSWPVAGQVGGQYAATLAHKHGWSAKSTTVFICLDQAVGSSVEAADYSFAAAMKKFDPKVPAKNYYMIECGPTESSAGAPVSAWINSHPGVQNLVVFALNDEIALGASNALSRAGRSVNKNTLMFGTGLDKLGVQEIYAGHETGSVTFFPERYGNYIIPEIEAALSGEAIPSMAGPPAIGVSKANISKYYKANGNPA
jgi:ribose transport system substrate-binding protein